MQIASIAFVLIQVLAVVGVSEKVDLGILDVLNLHCSSNAETPLS